MPSRYFSGVPGRESRNILCAPKDDARWERESLSKQLKERYCRTGLGHIQATSLLFQSLIKV